MMASIRVLPRSVRLLLVFTCLFICLSSLTYKACAQPSTAPINPYKVLGISKDADEPELKRAHKKLAIKYHPDKNPGEEAKEQFLKVQRAYEILSDPEKRRNYDTTGFADEREASAAGSKKQYQQAQQGYTGNYKGWDSGDGSYGKKSETHVDAIQSTTPTLTARNFERLVLNDTNPWIIQIYHDANDDCIRSASSWEQAADALEGIARLGRINYAREAELVRELAPRFLGSTLPVRPDRLPVVVGFPAACSSPRCRVALYKLGKRTVDADQVYAFAGDRVVRLARVQQLEPQSLDADLAGGAAARKAMMVVFTTRGSTPTPLLRKLATKYADSHTVARVVYTKADAKHWRAHYGVQSSPAVLFVTNEEKTAYHGAFNMTYLEGLMLQHRLAAPSSMPSFGVGRYVARMEFMYDLWPGIDAATQWAELLARAVTTTTIQQYQGLLFSLLAIFVAVTQLWPSSGGDDDEDPAEDEAEGEKRASPAKARKEKTNPLLGNASGSADSDRALVKHLDAAQYEALPPGCFLATILIGVKTPTKSEEANIMSNFQQLKMFLEVACHFKQETRIAWAIVNVADQGAWRGVGQGESDKQGVMSPIVVWHPVRHRYQSIQGAAVSTLVNQLEKVLDGGGSWVTCEIPKLVKAAPKPRSATQQ